MFFVLFENSTVIIYSYKGNLYIIEKVTKKKRNYFTCGSVDTKSSVLSILELIASIMPLSVNDQD